MWLRMVQKAPLCSRAIMPEETGKTWWEWVAILNAGNQRQNGITPVMRYLMVEYKLSARWARTIAIQYVLQ